MASTQICGEITHFFRLQISREIIIIESELRVDGFHLLNTGARELMAVASIHPLNAHCDDAEITTLKNIDPSVHSELVTISFTTPIT